jgi:glycosyltransferase involved in cell wall biosynthesis
MSNKKIMSTIIFYAPTGKNTAPEKIGGAEAGCKKTISILQKAGFRIILLDKPVRNNGMFRYLYEMLCCYFHLLKLLHKNKKSILHIAGFYLDVIYFEWLFLITFKLMCRKVVYEIRNGDMIEAYKRRNYVYKTIQDSIFKNSSMILCQGTKYVKFLKEQYNISAHYYPNYLMNDFVGPNNSRNFANGIRLIFFGRIVQSKNIDIMIKTTSILQKKYKNVSLSLIGGYSEGYKQGLLNLIQTLNLSETIINFYGRQDFTFIASQLKETHFFLFPSQAEREGHSNSLIEAMGHGVVPIASKVGFNESVCGDKQLIMEFLSPESCAKQIEYIMDNQLWQEKSDFVYKRVITNFTERIVGNNLIDWYNQLLLSLSYKDNGS